MARWVCPECEREFALARQAHVCVPGGTVDDTFAGRPTVQREIYDAILDFLTTLGPVHEDSVKVGVFLKREAKLAEIRPMARGLSVMLLLPRRIDSPRFQRYLSIPAGRVVHFLRLTAVTQVDDEVRGWLAEAYLAAG